MRPLLSYGIPATRAHFLLTTSQGAALQHVGSLVASLLLPGALSCLKTVALLVFPCDHNDTGHPRALNLTISHRRHGFKHACVESDDMSKLLAHAQSFVPSAFAPMPRG